MAKNVINEKGFKVIALTPQECALIGFGVIYDVFYELICDSCNDVLNRETEVYYVPVLNRVFCEKCFTNWYNVAINYAKDADCDDAYYEIEKYNWILNRLKEKADVDKLEDVELNIDSNE